MHGWELEEGRRGECFTFFGTDETLNHLTMAPQTSSGFTQCPGTKHAVLQRLLLQQRDLPAWKEKHLQDQPLLSCPEEGQLSRTVVATHVEAKYHYKSLATTSSPLFIFLLFPYSSVSQRRTTFHGLMNHELQRNHH